MKKSLFLAAFLLGNLISAAPKAEAQLLDPTDPRCLATDFVFRYCEPIEDARDILRKLGYDNCGAFNCFGQLVLLCVRTFNECPTVIVP